MNKSKSSALSCFVKHWINSAKFLNATCFSEAATEAALELILPLGSVKEWLNSQRLDFDASVL